MLFRNPNEKLNDLCRLCNPCFVYLNVDLMCPLVFSLPTGDKFPLHLCKSFYIFLKLVRIQWLISDKSANWTLANHIFIMAIKLLQWGTSFLIASCLVHFMFRIWVKKNKWYTLPMISNEFFFDFFIFRIYSVTLPTNSSEISFALFVDIASVVPPWI